MENENLNTPVQQDTPAAPQDTDNDPVQASAEAPQETAAEPQQQHAPYGAPQQQYTPYGAPQQQYAPYGAPQQQYAPYGAPVKPIKVNRGLAKYILLSIITFGIYPLVFMSGISTDINLIASRYDGKKTMHFCLVFFIFSWLTFGIVPIVWYHNLSARIGRELGRRGIGYSFGAGSFWGWNVLGSLIFVGPFIYLHKLCKSMNLLAGSYNVYG